MSSSFAIRPRVSSSTTLTAFLPPPALPTLSPRPSRSAPALCLSRTHIHLPSREISLEVLSSQPSQPSQPSQLSTTPPLLFIPGSLHASWCYAPLLSSLPFPASAISLRGHTSLPTPPSPTAAAVHTEDILAFAATLPSPPIIVAHSLGAYFAQRAALSSPSAFAGLVLLAPTPPSGNSRLIWRSLWRQSPAKSARITLGFARGLVGRDAALAREVFFSAHESDDDVARYMAEFRKSLVCRNDVKSVKPLVREEGVLEGRVLVIGGRDDALVDVEALEETAAFWGADAPVVIDDTPHDLMLTKARGEVARRIVDWAGTVGAM